MPNRHAFAEVDFLARVAPKRLREMKTEYLGPGNYPAHLNQRAARQFDLASILQVACFRHWEIDVEDWDAQRSLDEGVDIAVDYFYGDHLQTNPQASFMRKAPDNRSLSWFEIFPFKKGRSESSGQPPIRFSRIAGSRCAVLT